MFKDVVQLSPRFVLHFVKRASGARVYYSDKRWDLCGWSLL